MENILIDELPHEVMINNEPVSVNYGYRAHILIEICMFSDRDDEQKLLDALNLFYFGDIPTDISAAIKALLLFHRCGKEPKNTDRGKGSIARCRMRAYCFEQDAPMIYAAFRTQYSMNLNQTKNDELHWWEFMALFDSLSDNLMISRVMYYRTADLKNMGKNQRAFIKKMRALYALRHEESDMDARTKLAKRNLDMKEYVRKRMEECRNE